MFLKFSRISWKFWEFLITFLLDFHFFVLENLITFRKLMKIHKNHEFCQKNCIKEIVFRAPIQGIEEKYELDLDRNWLMLKNRKAMGTPIVQRIRKKSTNPKLEEFTEGEMGGEQPEAESSKFWNFYKIIKNKFLMILILNSALK